MPSALAISPSQPPWLPSFGKALIDGCDRLCDGPANCLLFPCRACGMAIRELASFCRSPFALYLSVALGCNFPPIIYAIKDREAGGNVAGDCLSASGWLGINAILCSVNIVAALYVSAKILYDPDAREHGAGPDPGDAPYIEASVFSGTRGVKKVPPIGRWYPPPMPPAWPAGSASMSLPPGPDHTRAPGTSSATTQQSLPTSSLIPSSPSGLAGGGSDGGGMWRSTFGVHLEVRFFSISSSSRWG